MNLKNARVLVTGATGFIGKHLINSLLKEKAKISIICRKKLIKNQNIKIYSGDLTDSSFLNKAIKEINPEKIFHLAAFVNPSRDILLLDKAFQVNFFGTANLLNSLKNIDYESLVLTSTAEVYGNNRIPFKEDMPLNPLSPYSLSKASAEIFCNMLYKNNNYPIIILRLSLVYGPGQNTDRFLPQLLTTLLKNKEFSMTKGEQKRDYIFVKDVVEALIKSSSSKNAIGQTINICSGKQHTIKYIASRIAIMLNAKKLIRHDLPYRKNEQWSYCGDITKAKKILNWKPKTNINTGLKKTIDWYKHYIT